MYQHMNIPGTQASEVCAYHVHTERVASSELRGKIVGEMVVPLGSMICQILLSAAIAIVLCCRRLFSIK